MPSRHENDNPIAIIMDSNKSLTATFVQVFTLTITSSTGGTTSPSPGGYTYDSGVNKIVVALPNSGYNFNGGTGDFSGIKNPIIITMDSNKSTRANFIAIEEEEGDGKSKFPFSCFITTAAYGSPIHPHVEALRNFRDKYLQSSKLGRKIVDLYYKYSPSIADFIAKHAVLKVAVRIQLMPLIIFSYLMVHFGSLITSIILIIILGLPIFLFSVFKKKSRFVEAEEN